MTSQPLVILFFFLIPSILGCLVVTDVFPGCGCTRDTAFLSWSAFQLRRPLLAANYTSTYPVTYDFINNCSTKAWACSNWHDDVVSSVHNTLTFTSGSMYYVKGAICNRTSYQWTDLWNNVYDHAERTACATRKNFTVDA